MTDSKTKNISIGEMIKGSEMLEFLPDPLKTKRMCKLKRCAVKKLPFLIKYVPDRYKT